MNLFDLVKVSNEDANGVAITVIEAELTPAQLSKFNNWFSGKTGGITDTGIFFVFTWDWEHFLENELGLLRA